MTGHHDRVWTFRTLQPPAASKPATAYPMSLMRKMGSMVIVTLAFAACSVPVVILAMQTAAYVFGY